MRASNLSQEDSRETKLQEVSKSVHRSPEVSERTQQRNRSVQKSSRTAFTQTEKLELQPIVFSKPPQQISCSPDLPVEKYKPDPGLLTQIVQVHFSSVDQEDRTPCTVTLDPASIHCPVEEWIVIPI